MCRTGVGDIFPRGAPTRDAVQRLAGEPRHTERGEDGEQSTGRSEKASALVEVQDEQDEVRADDEEPVQDNGRPPTMDELPRMRVERRTAA